MSSVNRRQLLASILAFLQQAKDKYLLEAEPEYTKEEIQSQFIARFGCMPDELRDSWNDYLDSRSSTGDHLDLRTLLDWISDDETEPDS